MTRNSLCQSLYSLLALQSLNYNVPGGKLIRAFAVISTAETLKGRPLTDAEYLKVAVLGWCIELVRLVSRM